MLVVDLMHEFELGVWKVVFIHLLRILDCEAESLKHKLNGRYVYLDLQVAAILITLDFEKYLHLGVMEYERQDQTDPN